MRQSAGPARYKRKRGEAPGLAPLAESSYDEHSGEQSYEEPFEDDATYREPHFELDPLDAQNAGLHDHELTLGHEEIHLNLDDDPGAPPVEHPATLKHD